MTITLPETSKGASRPRVTMLMPAYNVERYIGRAIESVLNQTFTQFELLVIDDASTDGTLDVVDAFASDSRVRVVRQEQNRGRPSTRNHGLDIAEGEYVAFLDADDYCAPQRLAKQVAYLDTNPDIGGVGSWKKWVDQDGTPVAAKMRRFPLEPDEVACKMIRECTLGQTSLMLRRAAIGNYRYDPAFPYSEDYELWARMIEATRFANLKEPLTYYRRHTEQSISAHHGDQELATLQIYSYQIEKLGVEHEHNPYGKQRKIIDF